MQVGAAVCWWLLHFAHRLGVPIRPPCIAAHLTILTPADTCTADHQLCPPCHPADQVNSDIAIWTSAFVLLTLMVNAPSVRCAATPAALLLPGCLLAMNAQQQPGSALLRPSHSCYPPLHHDRPALLPASPLRCCSTVMHWLRLDRISREKQASGVVEGVALLRLISTRLALLRAEPSRAQLLAVLQTGKQQQGGGLGEHGTRSGTRLSSTLCDLQAGHHAHASCKSPACLAHTSSPSCRPSQAMRAKAKRALLRFTGAAIDTLRDDEEEFLQGEPSSLPSVSKGASSCYADASHT